MKVRVKKAVSAPLGLVFRPVEPAGKPGDEVVENGVSRKLTIRDFVTWRFLAVSDDLGEGRLRIRQRDIGFCVGMELLLPDEAILLFGKQKFSECFEILEADLAPSVKLQPVAPAPTKKLQPVAPAPTNDTVPTSELIEPMGERVIDDELIESCKALVAEGKELTKSGRPKVDAVRDLLGRDVTAAEIDDAMAVLEG